MDQEGANEPVTAPVHPMPLAAAKEPATEAAAAWPSATCLGEEDAYSEGSGGGAADSTPGTTGGASHVPASTSAATAATLVPSDVAAAADTAVATAAAATVSCAAAAAAATVAAAVATGIDKHGPASVPFAAAGGASEEGEGSAASVLGAAKTAAAVGATSTSSSGSSSDGGAVASVAARAVGKGDQTRAGKQPRSLSAWLKEGPFVLSMSPGFFGFYAHIGALIALEAEGLLEAVSFATGASAGGLVAGLFAAGLSPADMGDTVVKFQRSDFWDPVGFGGLLRGKKFEEIVKATLPPGVRRFDQCRVPLAVSAFDASRLTTRTLEEGCLAQALRATCTFPVLFAPVWHKEGVLVDGGVRDTTGMWCVPERRENCRRVLNVTFGDKDGRGVCVPPSSFPTASNPRRTTDDMEIVSLPLTGLPRPHPFAMERGADAMEAARSQVAAVVGLPLLEGHEASHWIVATSVQPPAMCAHRDGINAAHVSGGASTSSSIGDRGGVIGGRAAASDANSSNGRSGNSFRRSALSAAPDTTSSAASTAHGVPAFRHTMAAVGGKTAMVSSTSTRVGSASLSSTAASPAGNEGGLEAGKGAPAAPVGIAASVPVQGAPEPSSTGPTKPTEKYHQPNAPRTAGAVGTKDSKKRPRASAVERLRAFNRQGLDGSDDERRSGKRTAGVAKGAPRGRTATRARQPRVPWMG